ncbi:MAG: hypothetical protein KBA06_01980 [Saprospiraceae bacterium]|nr:hypothetical protein [Saprospiraceae bacterium]
MKNKLLLLIIFCTAGFKLFSQDNGDDLLSLLGDQKEVNHITNAFKSSRVINSQSIEMLHAGALDFRILHRFGEVSGGGYQFFGLDEASMRLGFDYGITENITVGIGRSTAKKELDGFVKWRLLWQQNGKRNVPISLVWVSGMTVNGLKSPFTTDVDPTFTRRTAYYHQLVIGRKFSERFSLQLSPTLVHRNYVEKQLDPNNIYALGLGGRYKLGKRVAVLIDYSFPFNRFPQDILANPLSLGFDIDTGGHVFQLHFSNAKGMNERAFITDTNGNWLNGEIRFGFNLSRIFQLKKKTIPS